MPSHAQTFGGARTRAFHDHQLDRQRVLAQLRRGEISARDVRDASHHLLNSAEVLGAATNRACPLCGAPGLKDTLWIHGAGLGEKSGTARSVKEIDRVVEAYEDFSIHTVEVCMKCRWNFLIREEMIGAQVV